MNIILTPREKEIFNLLIENNTTKEISNKLNISEKTVRNHISNVMPVSYTHLTLPTNIVV